MIVGFVLVLVGSALATRRPTPAAEEGTETLEVIGA
jgi:hypothetical protein